MNKTFNVNKTDLTRSHLKKKLFKRYKDMNWRNQRNIIDV